VFFSCFGRFCLLEKGCKGLSPAHVSNYGVRENSCMSAVSAYGNISGMSVTTACVKMFMIKM